MSMIKSAYACDNRMPGTDTQSNKLSVEAVITVGNTAIEPLLVKSTEPSAGDTLTLELQLNLDGIGLTVLNDKQVRYEQASGADIRRVNIIFNGKTLESMEVEIAV